MSLRPWTRGPFELILHGELHYRIGDDFDRRVALISFDNAIEVAITNYLSLHPIHRQGREYEGQAVKEWVKNFHTKMDFLCSECLERGVHQEYDKEDLVWYHGLRNRQYHEGTYAAPNLDVLLAMRSAALWVFSTLYEVSDIHSVLESELSKFEPEGSAYERVDEYDEIIDSFYEPVELPNAGPITMSALLYQTDPAAYTDLALQLMDTATTPIRAIS